MTVPEEELEKLFNSLVETDCLCEMRAVLTPLSENELQAIYEDVLLQYSQELALGALERSEWLCGNLIINANQPSIRFLRAALNAVRSEMDKRKVTATAGTGTEILN